MQKILSVFKWFSTAARFALLGWAAASFIFTFGENGPLSVLALCPVLLLLILDICRFFIPHADRHTPVRVLLAIALCGISSAARQSDMIQIYYFFLLDDIFNIPGEKGQKVLIAVHFIAFWATGAFRLVSEKRDALNLLKGMLLIAVFYGLLLLIFAIIHYFKSEQERLKTLNADLIAYSFEEREYLLAKERGRISQELHDSIGHSLMAVLMNVRYLKAIQSKSQAEKDKQIDEIETLLKECVSNLRSSVGSLRELEETIDLRKEIERILQRFDELGLVKIGLNYDDGADKAPNRVKSVLFKTIREGITNSIRHGGATFIQISIRCTGGRIELIVKDNGAGCDAIRKSLGLNGITARVEETGGEVWFASAKNKGFTIRALLPGEEF